jgi:hypothetical protein
MQPVLTHPNKPHASTQPIKPVSTRPISRASGETHAQGTGGSMRTTRHSVLLDVTDHS